eukprot:CAMPEP_0174896006 /NCGR_PEP_ID=MMETSP0167-20121228/10275_1 /TAXON_ID=38298 /ORGANISM="Rhodella maculata, Strain CCMP736" /LENGTH=184 /DNA_ID=CAMNT_0016135451 /DNA_START=127 /DNA_END=681 /DNA_ORIENTATION=+
MASDNKRFRADGDGKGSDEPKTMAHPTDAFLVRWTVEATIESFGDDAFVDCNRDEYEEQMETYTGRQKDISGVSDVAYGTIDKANAAALKKLEALGEEHLGCYKCIGDKENDDEENSDDGSDDESCKFVSVSPADNGGKNWDWEYKEEDEGGNHWECKGEIYIETIRVIEYEGKVFKESSLKIS